MTSSQINNDRALARRVASGDSSAFDEYFREYFPRLYRFTLTRVGGNAGLAEEVVQRTLCATVRKLGSYRGEALLFTWLCQICRNEIAGIYREQGLDAGRHVSMDDNPAVRAALESMESDSGTPEDSQRNDEVARFVRATLEYLPARYATALELKYIRGLSVDEIGQQLNISSKAAESVLSRAREAFKEGFRSHWEFEPDMLLE